jgi:alkylhydroperoxidase family enzyme
MRVHIADADCDNPRAYVARTYAPRLVAAAIDLGRAGYEHSRLSLREFEAGRARTAEINGCRLCQNWRSSRDVPGFLAAVGVDVQDSVASHGPAPDEAFYAAISEWRASALFSPREKLAIEFSEGMGLDPQRLAADEDFWTRIKAAYSDDEIVDLAYCVASWMGLGRVSHVLGLDDVCNIGNLNRVGRAGEVVEPVAA